MATNDGKKKTAARAKPSATHASAKASTTSSGAVKAPKQHVTSSGGVKAAKASTTSSGGVAAPRQNATAASAGASKKPKPAAKKPAKAAPEAKAKTKTSPGTTKAASSAGTTKAPSSPGTTRAATSPGTTKAATAKAAPKLEPVVEVVEIVETITTVTPVIDVEGVEVEEAIVSEPKAAAKAQTSSGTVKATAHAPKTTTSSGTVKAPSTNGASNAHEATARSVPKVPPRERTAIDGWARGHLDEAQRKVLDAIRNVVKKVAPQATEAVKWAQPVWEKNGPFAFLKAGRKSVTFGFWRGAELRDPRGLLEGAGERMRHIRLKLNERLPIDAIADFVREAVRRNETEGDPTRRR